jgi:hypothetical protein
MIIRPQARAERVYLRGGSRVNHRILRRFVAQNMST